MNLLLLNYGNFSTNSLVHIAPLARELGKRGHAAVVAVPAEKGTASELHDAPSVTATFAEVLDGTVAFPDGRAEDIIHVWTPRESVREFVSHYQAGRQTARLVVHLEDNEALLTEIHAPSPGAASGAMSQAEPLAPFPPYLSHPARHQNLLHLADGVSVITPRLLDCVPAGSLSHVLTPGITGSPATTPASRAELGAPAAAKIIVFTGSDSFANAAEIDALYDAVHLLNEQGLPTHLVRTGKTPPAAARQRDVRHVTELGFVPWDRLAAIWAAADVLVQPGAPGEFNDYRLPSKLPEYFAAGRPVVLPAANVGLDIRNGIEGLLLHRGTADEIASACRRIFDDPRLADTLARGAREFGRRTFDWSRTTDELVAFYERVLAAPPRADWRGIPASDHADLRAVVRQMASSVDAGPEVGLQPLIESQIQDLIDRLTAAHARHDQDVETIRTLQAHLARCESDLAGERSRITELQAMEATLHRTLGERDQAIREYEQLLSSSRRHLDEVQATVVTLHDKVARMQASASWRMTSPFRALRRKLFD